LWFVEIICATLNQLVSGAVWVGLDLIVIQTFKQKSTTPKIDQLSIFVGELRTFLSPLFLAELHTSNNFKKGIYYKRK